MVDTYNIFGFCNKSFDECDESEADHKMQGKGKRQATGAVRIMLDEFGCDHVYVFKVKNP